ncbi:Hypothetical protein POVN_LOCUS119 [uncultured virus]|nr:Hypothetical protein POVN_LOCUS119 [uncultured virus]
MAGLQFVDMIQAIEDANLSDTEVRTEAEEFTTMTDNEKILMQYFAYQKLRNHLLFDGIPASFLTRINFNANGKAKELLDDPESDGSDAEGENEESDYPYGYGQGHCLGTFLDKYPNLCDAVEAAVRTQANALYQQFGKGGPVSTHAERSATFKALQAAGELPDVLATAIISPSVVPTTVQDLTQFKLRFIAAGAGAGEEVKATV